MVRGPRVWWIHTRHDACSTRGIHMHSHIHAHTPTHTGVCCFSWWSLGPSNDGYPRTLPLSPAVVPFITHHEYLTCCVSLSLPLSLSYWWTHMQNTHTSGSCSSSAHLPPAPTRLLVSTCGLNPGVIDGMLPDANAHTHAHRNTHSHCPLSRPIAHGETPVTNASWSSVTNKNSPETDRLLGCSDLLSVVCSLFPSPLALITFLFFPLLDSSPSLPSASHELQVRSSSSPLSLALYRCGGVGVKRGCGHLQPTDVRAVDFY